MSLESLNKRIKSTTDLREIVSTMKLLSSVSITPYEKALASLKKYGKTLEDAFQGLMLNEKDITPPLLPKDKSFKTIAILIGTDNGLVGKFNRDVITHADTYFKAHGYDMDSVIYLCIGKRINGLMSGLKDQVAASYAISNSLREIALIASEILKKTDEIISKQKVKQVLIFHNHRESGMPQRTEKRQLIPLPKNTFAALKQKRWEGKNFPLITADKEALFSALSHEFLTVTLTGALTASLAAEHYARMVNMQQAEKNIDESLETMNLEYQQARQTAITDELIDIVSGAESMRKKHI